MSTGTMRARERERGKKQAHLLFEPVSLPRNGLGFLRIVDNHGIVLGEHSQRRDVLRREQ